MQAIKSDSIIAKRVVEFSEKILGEKRVKDLVVGISLIACELDDGAVGVSYVLRNTLPPFCSAFGFAQNIIGKKAKDIARFLTEGTDNLERGIAAAVLSAGTQSISIKDDNEDKIFDMDFANTDVVGMIGLIGGISDYISKKVKKLIIFDEAVSSFGMINIVHNMEEQKDLLPMCNKLIITGTTMINGTIDSILKMSSNLEEAVMVGASTPMYKEVYVGTKIKSLAGAWWRNDKKDELFKRISLAGGITQVKEFMIKKVEKV